VGDEHTPFQNTNLESGGTGGPSKYSKREVGCINMCFTHLLQVHIIAIQVNLCSHTVGSGCIQTCKVIQPEGPRGQSHIIHHQDQQPPTTTTTAYKNTANAIPTNISAE